MLSWQHVCFLSGMKMFFVFSLSLLVLGDYSWAQSKGRYQGEFTYLGEKGRAEFEYVLSTSNEQIKDGRFIFEFARQNDLPPLNFEKKTYAGFFSKGLREGLWEIMSEAYCIKIKDVADFKVESEISGIQTNITAQYKNGKPQGSWGLEKKLVENGEITKLIQSDKILFKNGKLSDKLEVRVNTDKHSQFIKGKLSEGFLTGEWTFTYLSEDRLIHEVRNYTDGFLLGLIKRDLLTGKVLEEAVYFDTIDQLNAVKNGLSKGFRIADQSFDLSYTDGFLSSDPNALIQSDGNAFLTGILKELVFHDPEFVDENGSLKTLPLHSKRMVYEISRSDQKLVEELPATYQGLSGWVLSQLNDPSFRANKLQSDSLAFVYRFFEMQHEKLVQLEELMQLIQSKQIQFYNPVVLSRFAASILPQSEEVKIRREKSDQAHIIHYSEKKFQTDLYGSLFHSLTEIQSKGEELASYVDRQLASIRQDEELIKLSRRLDLKRLEVMNLYANPTTENSLSATLKSRFLINQMEIEDLALGQLMGFDQKKSHYERMEVLMETMTAVHARLEVWFIQKEEIENLYQEEVFNPFTYTRYNQQVKTRILEAYELLYEHYLDSFAKETDFSKLNFWISRAEKLGNRMRVLRTEDTRRLEKALNQTKSISKLESHLGL